MATVRSEAEKTRRREYVRAWRLANPEKEAEYLRRRRQTYPPATQPYNRVVDGMKRCRDCDEVKPVAEFPMQGGWLTPRCRPCHRVYRRSFVRDYAADYARRDKEREREMKRVYYIANRARLLARALQWQRDNPEKVAQRELRRRARKRDAAGMFTAQQLQARWDFFGGQCWLCREPATGWDHVIPLARGGSNWPANLRPACRSCNARKKDRPWREVA